MKPKTGVNATPEALKEQRWADSRSDPGASKAIDSRVQVRSDPAFSKSKQPLARAAKYRGVIEGDLRNGIEQADINAGKGPDGTPHPGR